MSGSDVSSPEVIRDDGSRSNLMMVASDENIASYPLRQVLDKNDNKTELIAASGIDDDDISAAIASASFVIPELKGADVEDVLDVVAEGCRPVHVSTPSLPGKAPLPRRLNFSGVEVPPTPFNSFDYERSDADLEEAIVTEAANLEMHNKLQLAAAKAATATAGTMADAATASSSSDGSKKRTYPHCNRKDICKGMSVEEVERLSEDMKVTEYKAPNSIYDKEVRRRAKIATCLSMLRQVVPGVTEDTDNTAVFEKTAKYVTFLREKVGDQEQDKLFLKERMTL